MIIRFLLIFTIFFPHILEGQTPFTNYSLEDGLPSNECNSIGQDNLGYIWIATNNGISRFDGYEFKTYTTSHGLPSNEIINLYSDSKERLWLVPLHFQPTYIMDGSVHSVPISDKQREELDDYVIKVIIENREGKILVIYHSLLIYEYDPLTNIYRKILDFESRERFVPVFYRGSGSNLLISSGGTVYTDNGEKGAAYLIDDDSGALIRLKSKADMSLYMKSYHNFASRDDLTIFHLIPDSALYTIRNDSLVILAKYSIPISRHFGFDKKGDFWLGLAKQGVYIYEQAKFDQSPKKVLDGYTITSRLIDNEGNYWYSTVSKGIFFTPNENLIYYSADKLGSSKLRSIAGLGPNIYISTQEKDFYHINKDRPVKLSLGDVSYLVNFNDSFIVITTPDIRRSIQFNGIVEQTFSNNSVECIYETDSLIYLGFRRRIFVKGKGEKEFQNNLRLGKYIFSITSYNDQLIVGTEQGILSINDSLLSAVRDRHPNLVNTLIGFENFDNLHDSILSPYLSHIPKLKGKVSGLKVFKEHLVISMQGNGVYIVKDDSVKQSFENKDELQNDFSSGLYLDQEDNLYSYGMNGFASFSFNSDGSIERSVYRQIDGAGWSDLIGMHIYKDSVWLAAKSGISLYKKENFSLPSMKPLLYFEEVLVNQNRVNPNELLNLKHYENNIRIDFKALSFRSLKNIIYRYRLNGAEWVETKGTNITFPSLPHGDYQLEIEAENPWGQKSEIATLQIQIFPPIYLRWWFVTLELLLLGILIFFFIRWRVNQMSSRAMINLEKYQNKHLALNAQLNPHFIFNSLTAIDQLVNKYESVKSSEYLRSFANLMRQTLENSKSHMVSLKMDLDLLREYLRLELLLFDEQIELIYDIDPELEEEQYFLPPMLLQPYVENVFQHAWSEDTTSRTMIIGAKLEVNNLYLYVEDNGVGLKASKEKGRKEGKDHHSSGMSISSSRIDLFNKLYEPAIKLNIESVYDKGSKNTGTRISILIPLKMHLKPLESIK